MARAFLSHSSSDKELVRKIASELGPQNSIIDEINFEPGRKTLEEIFDTLDKTDVFVLFISNKSLSSKWVQKEISRAFTNISKHITDRILPIIIDKTITYNDSRIPNWIKKPYNLKYIDNEVIVLKKIKQALREINLKKNKFNQELEDNFIGRNEETAQFENKINNIHNWIPTYIVAYNYFEGIGRRTFLKYALKKSSIIKPNYEPITIPLEFGESIENFIYKLNSLSHLENISNFDFSAETLESKIDIAENLVDKFLSFNEIIFIIDEGGIILPNNSIVDWFSKLTSRPKFKNRLGFCLVSKFRPNTSVVNSSNKGLVFSIPELSNSDTKNLFLKLLKIYKLENISAENKQYFIDNIKGIPSQIIFAVSQIELDLVNAKKNIAQIIEFSDTFSRSILEEAKKDDTTYQLILFLSKSEIISYELIIKVFGEGTETLDAVQKLQDLSTINFVLSDYEYIKLNSVVSDYITRSKLLLNPIYQEKLNLVQEELLSENLENLLDNDYSEFMLTLQSMLENKQKIPKKFFIPSLVLKNIIRKYNEGQYDFVIKICNELLENKNYDEQVIWETKYRLTLAYARTKNEKFYEHVKYFNKRHNNTDYNFLLGFYNRCKGYKDKALEYYYKVLEISKNHGKSKREIVNLLLAKGEYDDALELAKENYDEKKTSIIQIHSYFMCIIRKNYHISSSERDILKELMDSVERSADIKSEDILRCMKGEYEFAVNNNLEKAIRILKEAMNLNENYLYPKKALLHIYKKKDMRQAHSKLVGYSR